MKKFFIASGIALGIVVVFLVVVAVLKDEIIKFGITRIASQATGAPVHIRHFSLSLLKSSVRISGLKMYNPRGFPSGVLVSCPKINAQYDRSALFKKKVHIVKLEIELEEFVLVRNEKGKLNVNSLNSGQSSKPSKPSKEPSPLQIDLTTLGIGKLVYKDYTAGKEPVVLVRNVNKRKTYKNIPSVQDLVKLIIGEPTDLFSQVGIPIDGTEIKSKARGMLDGIFKNR